MKRTLASLLSLSCVAIACAAEKPWTPLFNGTDLSGWTRKNGKAVYEVKEGCIVGHSVPDSENSFLCTTRDYGDFELEFEVQVDKELNSGVQIRSASLPAYRNSRVHGYQVEIAVDGFSGGIYDEARRDKFLNAEEPSPAVKALLKENEWNHYRIVCRGDHLQTWVNGTQVTDLHDDVSKAGFIGLQVHGVGPRKEPLFVRWRNLKVREMAP